jgi:hypothetical protein
MNGNGGNELGVVSIDNIAAQSGKKVPDVLGLQIGDLFGTYSGKDPKYVLRLAVCPGCVLEIKKTNGDYRAKFSEDGEDMLYSHDALLREIILEHCKCGRYQ